MNDIENNSHTNETDNLVDFTERYGYDRLSSLASQRSLIENQRQLAADEVRALEQRLVHLDERAGLLRDEAIRASEIASERFRQPGYFDELDLAGQVAAIGDFFNIYQADNEDIQKVRDFQKDGELTQQKFKVTMSQRNDASVRLEITDPYYEPTPHDPAYRTYFSGEFDARLGFDPEEFEMFVELVGNTSDGEPVSRQIDILRFADSVKVSRT